MHSKIKYEVYSSRYRILVVVHACAVPWLFVHLVNAWFSDDDRSRRLGYYSLMQYLASNALYDNMITNKTCAVCTWIFYALTFTMINKIQTKYTWRHLTFYLLPIYFNERSMVTIISWAYFLFHFTVSMHYTQREDIF